MPLKKLQLRPGVNKENTRYANENGWYDSDKVRFREGTPEKIGGWQRLSSYTFQGICRSLWNWVTLGFANLIGVGTNLKFYIQNGGQYYDVTPIRVTTGLANNPFAINGTTTTVTVTANAHGAATGDFVTFSGASGANATTLNAEYQLTVVSANSYTITTATVLTPAGSEGGASVSAAYQISTGPAIEVPLVGWGAGAWSSGTWGTSATSTSAMRLWNQGNFGEDLIFGPRGGAIYYWDAGGSLSTRAVLLSSLSGSSDVPTIQNIVYVSDNRFVFAFGCNDYGSGTLNPMLVRWSNQEDPASWAVSATSQAGSLTFSHGSIIVTAVQTRQEIVVFTDSAVYSLQYLGLPAVWGQQILGDNISIINQNAAIVASGVIYWMGVDKFYLYDGRVQTLNCDLRKYIYQDINLGQTGQIFCGTSEGFNEVWWFYCSITGPDGTGTVVSPNTTIDRYVIYNYLEPDGKGGKGIWYYGTLARTAWLDSGLLDVPIAATYSYNLVNQETGVDNNETATTLPIEAYISSSEFDIDDGDRFGFIYRMLPDITFDGSTVDSPAAIMTLLPMQNSGSGYNSPTSVGGSDNATVTRTAIVPIEKYTGQVYIRVRGRQMIMKVSSTALGVQWQLGYPRIDIRQDGRR
jgi:hypothetical protein